MTTPEAQDILKKELAPLFPGFTYRNDVEGFVRPIPGGVQQILVPLVDYEPVFVFSLVMCVRLDEVEKIFNQFSGSPPRYHSMTVTSMTQLEYFFPRHQGMKEYRVSNADDIRKAVSELSTMGEKLRLFLDRLQDVQALDAAMNSPDGSVFDESNQPYRAMHAAILARLANNSKFEEIVARYEAEAQQWHDDDRDKLHRLVVSLRG